MPCAPCGRCGRPLKPRTKVCRGHLCTLDRAWERFYAKVELQGDCLVWTGSKRKDGYGTFSFMGVSHLAHRVAWFLIYGDWPQADELNHRCENPSCVRVFHLEALTFSEHQEFTHRHTRYVCPKGHAKVYYESKKKWDCRQCNTDRMRKVKV